MDLEDYGIQLDDDGRLVGFQAGKAAALLDWEHRKDRRSFIELCRKLYLASWARDNAVHRNELRRKRRAANIELARFVERLKAHKYYRSRNPNVEKVCVGCGKRWVSEVSPGLPRARSSADGSRGPLKGQKIRRWGRFCSQQCRVRHYAKTRLFKSGKSTAPSLTAAKAVMIRDRVSAGESRNDIARAFSVSYATVDRIVRRETWRLSDREEKAARRAIARLEQLANKPCKNCGASVATRASAANSRRAPEYCSTSCQRARKSAVLARRESAKRTRDARRAAGLCLLCGKPAAASRCESCKQNRRLAKQGDSQ